MGYRKALFLFICIIALYSCYPSNQYNNSRENDLIPIETMTITAINSETKVATASKSIITVTNTQTSTIISTSTYPPSITPMIGMEIWIGGSVNGAIIEYGLDKWYEKDDILIHNSINNCQIRENRLGGSDICMNRYCDYEVIYFGGIKFLRIIVESKYISYWSSEPFLGYSLSTEKNRTQCMKNAEEVLNTITMVL